MSIWFYCYFEHVKTLDTKNISLKGVNLVVKISIE